MYHIQGSMYTNISHSLNSEGMIWDRMLLICTYGRPNQLQGLGRLKQKPEET